MSFIQRAGRGQGGRINKFYGGLTLFFCGLYVLYLFGGLVFMALTLDSLEPLAGGLLFTLVYLLPLLLLLSRARKVLKHQVVIAAPDTAAARGGFYLGCILLVLALLSVLLSCAAIAYVLIRDIQGIPVGMGFGLAVMLYIAGASLVELCKADTRKQAD